MGLILVLWLIFAMSCRPIIALVVVAYLYMYMCVCARVTHAA